jgi:hypothetical protein
VYSELFCSYCKRDDGEAVVRSANRVVPYALYEFCSGDCFVDCLAGIVVQFAHPSTVTVSLPILKKSRTGLSASVPSFPPTALRFVTFITNQSNLPQCVAEDHHRPCPTVGQLSKVLSSEVEANLFENHF